MRAIVTDLTRFKNRDIVCTAAVDPQTGQCIRPMPYFSYEACRTRNIHPGMAIEAAFTPAPIDPPHTEDLTCDFAHVHFLGAVTSEEFERVLQRTAVPSIRQGFDNLIPLGQKVIPFHTPPRRSIITIRVAPSDIEVVDDAYNPEKIKLHIHDSDGTSYPFVGITDLGFHHYAIEQRRSANRVSVLNDFVRQQSHVYLRIGLSRRYAIGSRDGYWIQANGIYTFPDYLATLRRYP